MTHWTHNLDPIALSLGSLQIRWYGVMYLVGYITGYFLLKQRWKRGMFALNPEEIQVLITYLMIGMMLGARLLYMFVYHEHRDEVISGTFGFLAIWEGISIKGLAIGAAAAILVPNYLLPILGIAGEVRKTPAEWNFKKYWYWYVIATLAIARIFFIRDNQAHEYEYFLEIPAIWTGGLSYHGAAIGFVIASMMIGKKFGLSFFHIMDNVVFGAALGVFFGRMGNFINGELPGRTTDVAWGIIFPGYGTEPRHPSQLYQGFGEGLTVLLILFLLEKFLQKKGQAPQCVYSKTGEKNEKPVLVHWPRVGILCTSYLILYGVARFVVEFFRQPDAQLGFYFGFLSMGQILCFLMILAGAILLSIRIKNPTQEEYKVTPFP
ncbi:MAG: prolipoprotein diacylglyceryl transferase [Bdellovibrionales bacterium]|nr:prolipoprotein diacylglyceryl transferase [Bdellovibrionales bacterium]